MKGNDLDKAFGETPAMFSERLRGTLQNLEEKPKMKKFTLRTALIAALITLLVLGTAYAVATSPDLKWWITERVAEYDEAAVESIVKNVQSDLYSKSTHELVNVKVNQGVWLSDSLFQVTLSAELRDKDRYELHPEQNLDTDGACLPLSEPLPEDDEEARYESFLWTEKGFGLPKDYMDDPNKQLVLFGEDALTIGTTYGEKLSTSGYMDVIRAKDGTVQMTLAFELADTDPDKVREKYDRAGMAEYYGEAETDRMIQNAVETAQRIKESIKTFTDKDGYLLLVLHTHARLFTADANGVATFDYLYPDDPGVTFFKIKIN